MQSIIYDVAISIDGYISGPDGDISQFASEGPVVEDYMTRLAGTPSPSWASGPMNSVIASVWSRARTSMIT